MESSEGWRNLKRNLIASAQTKEKIESLINEYFFSKNYTVTDSGEIYNKSKGKNLDGYTVNCKNHRWRFEKTA